MCRIVSLGGRDQLRRSRRQKLQGHADKHRRNGPSQWVTTAWRNTCITVARRPQYHTASPLPHSGNRADQSPAETGHELSPAAATAASAHRPAPAAVREQLTTGRAACRGHVTELPVRRAVRPAEPTIERPDRTRFAHGASPTP